MERITMKHLEVTLSRINAKAGFDNAKWNTVGSYQLSGAYGGWKLEQVLTAGGGIRSITYGYCSKRELLEQMRAFLSGMEAVKTVAV